MLAEGATLKPSGGLVARAPLERIAARFGPLQSVHRGEFLAALCEPVAAQIEFGAEVECHDGGTPRRRLAD